MSADTRTPLNGHLDSAIAAIYCARQIVTDAVAHQLLTDAQGMIQTVINREQAARVIQAERQREEDQECRDNAAAVSMGLVDR